MLERSKLNNIDSMISKALVDNEMKNEKKKESIRMMKNQGNSIEKNKLIEEGRGIVIGQNIKRTELLIIIQSFNYKKVDHIA